MISLLEAQTYVLERCPAPFPVHVSLADARGLVLATTITSPEDVPPFANTAMDGFAVKAIDTETAPVDLKVIGTVAAGADPAAAGIEVTAGTAARIMTGAPIPLGADAVVMVERTRMVEEDRVQVLEEVPVGHHVRWPGEDLLAGAEVFPAGTTLGPGHLGVLSSIGVERLSAFRRPRVGVMSTGDELQEAGGNLLPGQIRDANRPSLLGLLAEMDIESVDLGRVPDEETAIAEAISSGVSECDALLTSGGVSMGDFDYVKVVLDRVGDMRWMQVAIKPAKPLAFGVVEDVPVFGLPGNPVSSMVSFELFARPALRSMSGHGDRERRRVRAVVEEDMPRQSDGKVHFVRVKVKLEDGRFHVTSAGGQGSHQLLAMAVADGLAVLPDGKGVIEGDEIEVLLLS